MARAWLWPRSASGDCCASFFLEKEKRVERSQEDAALRVDSDLRALGVRVFSGAPALSSHASGQWIGSSESPVPPCRTNRVAIPRSYRWPRCLQSLTGEKRVATGYPVACGLVELGA